MKLHNIPFSPPDMSEKEAKMAVEAILSGWLTTGPKTKEFERKIAEYCHTQKAVCLNSATAAMEIALRLIGVGPEDEIIVPAYTYTATASVTQHVGCKLVMVDSQENSVEMDYDKLASAVTEHTKVIMPVDLGGIIVDYDKVFAIVGAKKHLFRPSNKIQEAFGRVIVVADAAHAFGARRHGKMCGEIADFTSFSFHAVKNLTTAEGGALTWRTVPGGVCEDGQEWDEYLYKMCQLYSLHGQNKDALAKTKLGAWEYDIIGPWYKCNMTDIMAGIGLAQLERYRGMLERRQEIVRRYDHGLKESEVALLRHNGEDWCSSYHLYMVRLLGKSVEQRNEIIVKMAERGIACNVHYKPLPMMTAYKNLGFDIKDYPNAYHLYENEVTLPLHTRLNDDEVEYVISNFAEIIK